MLHPQTPTKADDGIERLKQSLSTQWGIRFPSRDSAWSPSRRDPNRVEDKILAVIQFLYFREGALHYAIGEFKKRAATIYSQWQFKPRGETGVIPSRDEGRNVNIASAVKRGFLHKRVPLEENATKELTECLWHHLSTTAERVKVGERFAIPVLPSIEKPKAASVEASPVKMDQSHRQSSLTQWFRSKSDPNTAPASAQHPSSDDYQDDDITDVFSDIQHKDAKPMSLTSTTSHVVPKSRERRISNRTSSTEEKFETPPTTPPRLMGANIGLGIGVEDSTAAFYDRYSELVPVMSRKRSYPESMKPPLPRKVSREQRSRDVYNADHLEPTTEPYDSSSSTFIMPTPPLNDQPFFTRPLGRYQSNEHLTSISSSMTSASSAWTTPNTSFGSDSMATSFSSSMGGGTDTTIRPMSDKLWDSHDPKYSAMQSEADSSEWEHFYQAQMTEAPRRNTTTFHPQPLDRPTNSGPDAMEIDSASIHAGIASKPSMPPPPGSRNQLSPTTSLEKEVAARLHTHSPFVPISQEHCVVSFRQLYETVRVSACCKLPLTLFSKCLRQNYQRYDDLWLVLSSVARTTGLSAPERSSAVAWAKAGENFEGVSLSGILKFTDKTDGPVFDFALNPLKIDASYRLARKFGHDRFCIIGVPGFGPESLPSYLKTHSSSLQPDHTVVRKRIIEWLVESTHCFLGRSWRVFFVKPESGKRTQKGIKSNPNDVRFRIYFFAVDGAGFRRDPAKSEIDPRMPNHVPLSVKGLVDWFMSSKNNTNQPALKLFDRLALGLTSTIPTVRFSPREIIRSDDALADNPTKRVLDFPRPEEKSMNRNPQKSRAPVMNDGCARISRDAANAVAAMLGMDHTPSVFQGRIGGAKGVWMVDALDEAPRRLAREDSKVYWIEVTDSQLKFAPHSIDALSPDNARVTFEVNKYSSKLSPGFLNFQLMPILEKGGVPQNIFKVLLEEDLSSRVGEQEVAMDDALSLRKWNQDVNPVVRERASFGGIEMLGGLPNSTPEKINWFVESGFIPKSCLFLKDQLYKAVHSYCMNLENRMKIELGRSTNAYIIADPLAVLEEGEIHVAFSSVFRDSKSGFDETMLHDIDVLVARLPAHLPSDIQKVHAVFKPELRAYRDVVVFPSKGDVSLASKLSGGDYDGDRVWMCWDPNIVVPFRNSPIPNVPAPESYGIKKDSIKVSDLLQYDDYMNRFLGHAFDFNLRMNMLGICTNYHEALCYHKNTIASREAIDIAALLGNLVDSNKQGYNFDEAKWAAYLKSKKLPRRYDTPAYNNKSKAIEKPGNLIDDLVFNVAKKQRTKALEKFTKHFKDVESWDTDLTRLRNEEMEKSKSNKLIAEVLENLKASLEKILQYWKVHVHREDDDDPTSTRKSDGISFRATVDKCRQDFVALAPITIKNILPTAHESNPTVDVPDTIRRWQRAHAAGKPSRWDLLKASVAFYHHHKRNFVWYIAGVELGQIKAMARGGGSYRIVVNEMFDSFKLDGKLVDGAKRREMQLEAFEPKAVAEDDDDAETEYGDVWSQIDPNDIGYW